MVVLDGVTLDGVTKVKDGESCILFGAVAMAVCGKMCFGKIHDEQVFVRAQAADEKRNVVNTEGTSRPYVFIMQICLLSPLPSSCPGACYLLLRLGIPGSLVFSPDLRCRSSQWVSRKVEHQELLSGRIVGPRSSCS